MIYSSRYRKTEEAHEYVLNYVAPGGEGRKGGGRTIQSKRDWDQDTCGAPHDITPFQVQI